MPASHRRPEIAPLAFTIVTPFALPLLWLVWELLRGPLGSPFVPEDKHDVLEVAMSVGLWGLMLLYLLQQVIVVACLMAIGAGGVWLLGRWLRLTARGVLSRAALGWLGWGLGLGLAFGGLRLMPTIIMAATAPR